MRQPLQVRVNDSLILDAGWWEEVPDDDTIRRHVHPPERTLFEQVIEYLESLPSPDHQGIHIGVEGVVATAVCLRWGSYLAVLADRHKPLWRGARQKNLSRIADSEMARINIEASAALEQWIELMRNDYDGYLSLMWKAASYLPVTCKRVQRERDFMLLALAHPGLASLLVTQAPKRQAEQAYAEAKAYPTRVLANALINTCYRNGTIEDIHSGSPSTYPLTRRRITPSEERKIVRTSAELLAQGIFVTFALIKEKSTRTWVERVLPFNLAAQFSITPTGWSLDERTRHVRLPGKEPEE
ncbi:MAG: hypothetical protein ONB15_06945 [candidate division KSB1 bacterium]|nr:hypothetical protein [candidate division KSB1 bacterium]